MSGFSQSLSRPPMLERGKTQVFGRGRNPINWVSAADVARFVELAVVDPAMRGKVIEVGGPENLTMDAFVDVFQTETGVQANVIHIPPLAMRLSAAAVRFLNPDMARQIRAGSVMDTRPQSFEALETRVHYPSIPVTTLREVVTRDFTTRETNMKGVATGSI